MTTETQPRPNEGKLIRRVYEVTVLFRQGSTETDMDSASLESLAYETDTGAASGLVRMVSEEVLDRKQMFDALTAQFTDPGFLLGEDATPDEENPGCDNCGTDDAIGRVDGALVCSDCGRGMTLDTKPPFPGAWMPAPED